uniref:Putative reverse transcriptase/maturase n=1 Tax=Flintiella sanguinaria TaxID=101926 RepID=A0A1X9PUA8_9RHOD|nr:putative reverse transcriptase/maturase [Flintiella sanguinaria]
MQPTVKSCVEEWKSLPWKKFEKVIFRLQHRIYKAFQNKDYNLVNRLQRCLANSRAGKYLSIRKVTQLNTRKKMASIDGVSELGPKERLNLLQEISKLQGYKHSKLRRVWIPESNGEKRPFGVPTIKDRVVQNIIKTILEPVYEAHASKGSYGLRSAISSWEIQKNIFNKLNSRCSGYEKSILELNIEKCFGRINYNKLMSMVILPQNLKSIVWSTLKAGVLNERPRTTKDIPQYGIISPLLCNIVLNGIEDIWNYKQGIGRYKGIMLHRDKGCGQRGLRYADNMIFFLKPEEDAQELRKLIDKFLSERGLNIKEAKTRLVKSTEGFDFLDWHFRVKAKNNKFLSYPSRANRKNMIKKIKETIRDSRFTLDERLKKVNIIYKRWADYHKYTNLDQVNIWSIRKWVFAYAKKLVIKYTRSSRKLAKKILLEKIRNVIHRTPYTANKFIALKDNNSIYCNNWIY